MIGPQLPTGLKRKIEQTDIDQLSTQPLRKKQKLNNNVEQKTNNSNNNNELMHPRNIYKYNKPNYYELSLKYKYFASVLLFNNLTNEYYINYNDAQSNVLLTKVLLKNDFNLEFEHPLNHLCPPISQRLNYILWIQDLLQCISCNNHSYYGFDIGCGASAIFPLLGIKIGLKQNEKWSFIASDIDKESIKYANNNIKINNFSNLIQIIYQNNSRNIFRGIIDKIDQNNNDILFDFTVCNPPFFNNLQETALNKHRINPATKSELVFEGGEVGFIKLMINEIKELNLYNRVYWFTTMIGKKISIKVIKKYINKSVINTNNCNVFIVTTEFYQGKQVRWGIAWTYFDYIKQIYFRINNKNNNNNNKICNKNEFLCNLIAPINTTNYDTFIIDKIKILLKKYGIKYNDKNQINYNSKLIQFNDIKNNGFTFNIKWIVDANNDKLSVLMTCLHMKGDKMLFNSFVKWFIKSISRK